MPTSARFAELLSQLARAVTARQAGKVCCGELTLEQFQTLRAVDGGAGAASVGTLAAALGVELSTMSRNVTLLERNGHLEKERSVEDGRVLRVGLTAKGRRALSTLRCEERDVLGEIFHRLPAGERPLVMAALESLASCLTASASPAQACCPPAPVPLRRRHAG